MYLFIFCRSKERSCKTSDGRICVLGKGGDNTQIVFSCWSGLFSFRLKIWSLHYFLWIISWLSDFYVIMLTWKICFCKLRPFLLILKIIKLNVIFRCVSVPKVQRTSQSVWLCPMQRDWKNWPWNQAYKFLIFNPCVKILKSLPQYPRAWQPMPWLVRISFSNIFGALKWVYWILSLYISWG